MHRKDIRAETMVIVERAGDVIPQVTGPADPVANREAAPFQMPSRCPTCGTRVETRPKRSRPLVPQPGLSRHCCPSSSRASSANGPWTSTGWGEHWCQELGEPGNGRKHRGPLLPDQGTASQAGPDGRETGGPDSPEHRSQQGPDPWRGPSTAWESSGWAGEVSAKLAAQRPTMDEIRKMDKEELSSIEGIGPGDCGQRGAGIPLGAGQTDAGADAGRRSEHDKENRS